MAERRLSEDIKDELKEVIGEIYKRYEDNENKFVDPGNPKEGLIMSCESLLCFLLPMINIPEIKEFAKNKVGGFDFFHKIMKEKIIDQSEKGFYGAPYINFTKDDACGQGKLKSDLQFLDSACFVASAILYFLKVFSGELKEEKTKEFRELLLTSLGKALELIMSCFCYKAERGWTYAKEEGDKEETLPITYCSWSVIETAYDIIQGNFDEYLSGEILEEKRDDLKSKIKREFTPYFAKYHFPSEKEEESALKYGNTSKSIIDFSDSPVKNDRSIYYNLYILIIGLYLNIESPLVSYEKAVKFLYEEHYLKNLDPEKRKIYNYTGKPFSLVGEYFDSEAESAGMDCQEGKHKKEYEDRCFLPLFLKAVILFYERYEEQLTNEKKDYFRKILYRLYKELMDNRKEELKVWDKYEKKREGYSIYYTQRAIEVLSTLYTLSEERKLPPPPLEGKPEGKIETEEVRKLVQDEATQLLLNLPEEIKESLKEQLKIKNMIDILNKIAPQAELKKMMEDVEKPAK